MTKRLDVTLRDAVDSMIAALETELDHRGIDYAAVAAVNNVNSIDVVIGDGGETRCEHFADHGWEYAKQFGEFADDNFDHALAKAVGAAWEEFKRRHDRERNQ